jgi:3-dehydroquinate synthetase
MICESYISNKIGLLGNTELKKITSQVISVFGHHPESIPTFEKLITIINKDKKNIGKEILGVGLDKIGEAKFNIPFTHDLIKDSLAYYCQKLNI